MENIDNNGASVNNSPETDTNQDYISAINEMKQNTVSKEQYLKLKEDNRRLLNSLVTGENIKEQEKPKEPDITELRNFAYGKNSDTINSIDYVQAVLKLRKAIMDKGNPDPAVPRGKKSNPTQADYIEIERTANILQECIDCANGDNNVFNAEIRRRLR